jgi:hypothetical protein
VQCLSKWPIVQSCLVQFKITFLLQLERCTFFFESLAIINTLGLQAFFMDIHHNTSFRSIQSSHSFLFRQGGEAMVDCWIIYMFIAHHTLYFHLNDAFSSQFDSTLNI